MNDLISRQEVSLPGRVMADNRMYIRCEICGKMLLLGKANRGKPWYKEHDEIPLEDRLNEFFANHTWCDGEQDNFRIVYETDDDFEYKWEQLARKFLKKR